MDQEITDLIEHLLVRVACIMEDASAEILIRAEDTLLQRVALAQTAATQIDALGTAAATLADQQPG